MEKFILVPPLVPIFFDGNRVIGVLHLSRILFQLDGFIERELRGLLFLLKHVRSLLFLLSEFRCVFKH